LRGAKNRLQHDLAGVTVIPNPPVNPSENRGYTEYMEGPVGPIFEFSSTVGVHDIGADGQPDLDDDSIPDGDGNPDPDTTSGDLDDVLMFTTRLRHDPAVGIFTALDAGNPVPTTMESHVAEVAYFVRGTTLYRRVLLVAPGVTLRPGQTVPTDAFVGFYGKYDLSVHQEGGSLDRNHSRSSQAPRLVPNTLGDLTKRENRFGHQPYAFPHDARFWGRLGLPMMRESSSPDWPFPMLPNSYPTGASTYQSAIYGDTKSQLVIPSGIVDTSLSDTLLEDTTMDEEYQQVQLTNPTDPDESFDPWYNPLPWSEVNPGNGGLMHYVGDLTNPPATQPTRVDEDVLLTNVLSFDVKVWDPGAPIFLVLSGGSVEGITVGPGDPGYLLILREFIADPADTSKQPISFGAYVDLNYMSRLGESADPNFVGMPNYPYVALAGLGAPLPVFHHAGDPRSRLRGTSPADATGLPPIYSNVSVAQRSQIRASVYDTWSTHYEYDGFNQDKDVDPVAPTLDLIDEGADGFDEPTGGSPPFAFGVDDQLEAEAPPPYRVPLRSIQVTIRVFEPDSRQIRQVTIQHEFIPE
jgi:hypothetical protein